MPPKEVNRRPTGRRTRCDRLEPARLRRRDGPRRVLDGGDDEVGPSNRISAAALNRNRVRVISDDDDLLLFTRKTLDTAFLTEARCWLPSQSRDIASHGG